MYHTEVTCKSSGVFLNHLHVIPIQTFGSFGRNRFQVHHGAGRPRTLRGVKHFRHKTFRQTKYPKLDFLDGEKTISMYKVDWWLAKWIPSLGHKCQGLHSNHAFKNSFSKCRVLRHTSDLPRKWRIIIDWCRLHTKCTSFCPKHVQHITKTP